VEHGLTGIPKAMTSQYYKVTAYVGTPHRNAVEVTIPLVGPAGPAGPAGTGLETLTTQGDTLYQGASTGQRLPIGSSGHVLRVNNGIPAWQPAPVTSVNGILGDVTIDRNIIPETIVSEEIDGTLASPTIVDVSSGYLRGDRGMDLTVQLDNATGIVYARVILPDYADSEDVVSVVRIKTVHTLNGDITYVRVVDASNGLVFPFPDSVTGYQEIAPGQGVEFAHRGRIWEIQPIGTQGQIILPSFGGNVLAFKNPPPPTKTSSGTAGQIAFDATYIYICVNSDPNPSWRRIPISNW